MTAHEVRIPVKVPPEVQGGWVQLLAYVPDDTASPLSDLAVVVISHLSSARWFTAVPCRLGRSRCERADTPP